MSELHALAWMAYATNRFGVQASILHASGFTDSDAMREHGPPRYAPAFVAWRVSNFLFVYHRPTWRSGGVFSIGIGCSDAVAARALMVDNICFGWSHGAAIAMFNYAQKAMEELYDEVRFFGHGGLASHSPSKYIQTTIDMLAAP